jgi:hypothetical protein
MTLDPEQQTIAQLEQANYDASARVAAVTPGLEVIIRPQVILTRSNLFPLPDANHAALIRATPDTAADLIEHIVAYYKACKLPATVALSPACSPLDLSERLFRRRFGRHSAEEAWLVLTDTAQVAKTQPRQGVTVRRIGRGEVHDFSQVYLNAYGYPEDFAPLMAEVMAASAELSQVYHYLAEIGSQPIGTLSLIVDGGFGILGSATVLRSARGSGATTNTLLQALADARTAGVHTIISHTKAGSIVERTLRLAGFRRTFVRQIYTLSS